MNFDALFSGELLRRRCGANGLSLLEKTQELVEKSLGREPEALDKDAFRLGLESCRARLSDESFVALGRGILDEVGIPRKGVMLDKLRLRAIAPGLEKIKQAAPVFYAHRDTWYGNPSCQINVWLPLQEVDSRNSFRFYLDHFEEQIANDSEHFKAEDFRGFGSLQPVGTQVYPRALEKPDGEFFDVSMKRGEILLFSAAHLHQTLPNRTQKVRFSLDFRFFVEEHRRAGQGAPDPDNRSRGLMTGEYRPCD